MAVPRARRPAGASAVAAAGWTARRYAIGHDSMAAVLAQVPMIPE